MNGSRALLFMLVKTEVGIIFVEKPNHFRLNGLLNPLSILLQTQVPQI